MNSWQPKVGDQVTYSSWCYQQLQKGWEPFTRIFVISKVDEINKTATITFLNTDPLAPHSLKYTIEEAAKWFMPAPSFGRILWQKEIAHYELVRKLEAR